MGYDFSSVDVFSPISLLCFLAIFSPKRFSYVSKEIDGVELDETTRLSESVTLKIEKNIERSDRRRCDGDEEKNRELDGEKSGEECSKGSGERKRGGLRFLQVQSKQEKAEAGLPSGSNLHIMLKPILEAHFDNVTKKLTSETE